MHRQPKAPYKRQKSTRNNLELRNLKYAKKRIKHRKRKMIAKVVQIEVEGEAGGFGLNIRTERGAR